MPCPRARTVRSAAIMAFMRNSCREPPSPRRAARTSGPGAIASARPCITRRFAAIDRPYWKTAPHVLPGATSLGQYRWDPIPVPQGDLTWLTGMRTMTTAGDVNIQVGMATHVYLVTASMRDEYFFSADSELLVVPQQGRLRFCTDLGIIDVQPQEIAILPRGLVYRVEVLEGPARGFVCENYGQKFDLPDRGPIGANCLANPRDFKTPVAAFEDRDARSRVVIKWCGQFHETWIDHSPLDVVARHGNYCAYKYDLRTYSPVGAILFDHPDPSIFTVLTAPSGQGRDGEHRLRAVSRPLDGGRTFLPPALVPQEHHVRADGKHPRHL